jgi:hypothetical protein
MRIDRICIACGIAVLAFAQTAGAQVGKTPVKKPAQGLLLPVAPHQEYHTVHLQTNVGSFKVLSPSPGVPAEGRIELRFVGSTVLVSGLQRGGVVTPGPGVRLEYNRPDRDKAVYFGTGTLVIDGKYEGIQFFGQGLTATYNGFGIIRLYGEFDKDLNTGYYWYTDPKQKMFWGTGGQTITTQPYATNETPGQIKVKVLPGKG